MYVAELDRSWLHSPFAGSGFCVSSPEQLATVRRHCRYVYVDPSRSDPSTVNGLEARPRDNPRVTAARKALERTRRRVASAIDAARHHGRIEIAPLRRAAVLLVDQLESDADGVLWAIHATPPGSLLYRRAVGTATLMAVFARHLGGEHGLLAELAVGGMLLDIGKTAVPVPILASPRRLSAAEQAFVERHVQRGVAMLRLDDTAPERAVEMLLGHHERLDGSGYPRRLRGTQIPVFARLAAIVDTYDALTLDRRYAQAVSPHDALRQLNALRARHFDAALVAEFVHAVGVYPTGTRVELTDGSVGIVCGQNPDWPLRPLVALTEGTDGRPLPEARLLESGLDGHIARTLPPVEAGEALRLAEQALPNRP